MKIKNSNRHSQISTSSTYTWSAPPVTKINRNPPDIVLHKSLKGSLLKNLPSSLLSRSGLWRHRFYQKAQWLLLCLLPLVGILISFKFFLCKLISQQKQNAEITWRWFNIEQRSFNIVFPLAGQLYSKTKLDMFTLFLLGSKNPVNCNINRCSKFFQLNSKLNILEHALSSVTLWLQMLHHILGHDATNVYWISIRDVQEIIS